MKGKKNRYVCAKRIGSLAFDELVDVFGCEIGARDNENNGVRPRQPEVYHKNFHRFGLFFL